MLGYNGEREDCPSGTYLLGNGYRAYSPALRRFLSPDGWSPFGAGGPNAYSYCSGDPVMGLDPSGHADLSGLRKVQQELLRQSRSAGAQRAQRQTAEQRVEALRGRLRQPVPQTLRTPMAQQGTEYLANRLAPAGSTVQQLPLANGARTPPRHEAAGLQPLDLAQAESLYQQLIDMNRHEQNFSLNLSYLAQGTELRQDYERDMAIIREHADQIRSRLGVDALSWFHF
ncbi:RHS repeat-associated core domain-containing protein [Pseudomonas monteilii]|uniref:RHS repeat-associated core domain-containing protein n=2 Tax=Pseudomonas monteilii TaxID=76759 RepID=A0A399M153_9PSED|nr:RHS repeat-associated core domain-containing protein [Pseudomonas monteilii]